MPGRILIVDDLAVSVKVLAAKLTSEFYDVLTAYDGQAALDAVSRDCPDLVLLDVMMPGMDGFEVCGKIKQSAETAHIPVVMVTALNDARDRVRGLQSGADDFLTKPVNDTMLFARVNSLIRMKRTFDQWKLHRETSRELGVDVDAGNAGDDGRGATITVVDTSNIHGENIQEILQREDHDVDLVASFAGAAKRVLDKTPDVVVISLDYDGEEALKLASDIRGAADTRNIPILLIGDPEDEASLIRGLDLGIDDCILRPVDDQEIIARVRTQVKRRRYQNLFRQNWESGGAMPLIDPATGLHSQRYLVRHLSRMNDDAIENGTPLSLALIGLDGAKFGAGTGTAGDLLKQAAGRIISNVRGFDLVARFGEEMFLLAMPDADVHVARTVVERLRTRMSDEPFAGPGNGPEVSLRAGVVTAAPNGEETAALMSRVEAAFDEAG